MTNQNDVIPLQLEDLVPQNATFSLDEMLDENETPVIFTIRRWSIRVREWAIKRFTPEGIDLIFKSGDVGALSELAFFMLDDESKKHFKNLEHFQDCIVSVKDQLAVIKAIAKSVGIGEPELERFQKALNKPKTPEDVKSPNVQSPG